jgi:transcriptional regulator with XRE-family HTH domain
MKPDQDSLSFGRYLQAIRLEKKISLEKVSAQTRIGLSNLSMIEQEDLEGLPDEVFVKGFLRAFAGAIGADGDKAVRRYESRLDIVQKIAVSEGSIGKSPPRMWWKLLISVILLAGIIGLSIFGIAFFHTQPDTGKSHEQNIPADISPPTDSQNHPDVDPDAETGKAVAEKLVLKITVLEDTWLKVIIDEKDSTEYSLTSGDKLELQATTGYNLLIGNSGGVKIVLNDKPVPLAGKSGEVVTIKLP